jgi:putative ABC transport system permease protein
MVLIAFVAVSLVVSCIMIGIITHISVLERTKEIGILRALGASKRNVSQVFNAETIIIGFISGVLGIFISWLITFPTNSFLTDAVGQKVNCHIPVDSAIFLILLSVIITVIGGLMPAKSAAKKDPVVALRTE